MKIHKKIKKDLVPFLFRKNVIKLKSFFDLKNK